jgi:hypothetical protein
MALMGLSAVSSVASARDVSSLSAHWQATVTLMGDVGQEMAEVIGGLQKQAQDDEAQKATLIEWLKAAQAEAAAKPQADATRK